MNTKNSSSKAMPVIKQLLGKYKMIFVFLGIILILSLSSDVFFTPKNLINVLRQVSINGVLAIGITFVIITGGIDLTVGPLVALSAVLATSLVRTNNENVWLAIIVGLAVGCAVGLITGSFISFFSVPPFIMTLAMQTICRGFALIYTKGKPVTNLGDNYAVIGQGEIGPIPIPVIILVAVIILGAVILNRTRFGRHVFAIGGNIEAAKVSGINTKATTITVYAISGLACGIAGLIMSSRVNAGQPAAGEGYELDAIAATVMGGTSLSGGIGSIAGTVIGVLIIGVISNGMNLLGVTSYWQQVAKGVIIAITVILDIYAGKRRAKK